MIDVMINGEPGKLEENNGAFKAVQSGIIIVWYHNIINNYH
jgi:hypothetical protein